MRGLGDGNGDGEMSGIVKDSKYAKEAFAVVEGVSHAHQALLSWSGNRSLCVLGFRFLSFVYFQFTQFGTFPLSSIALLL